MIHAHCQFEKSLWSENKKHIVGIDEVGRGAWAGPMVIGAVILPADQEPPFKLADSKLLSQKKREAVSELISKYAIDTAILEVPVDQINEQGLARAGQFGFHSILNQLKIAFDHILIDAFKIREVPTEKQTAIIKGDQQSVSIAAASIIAKVYRDKLMRKLHFELPQYSFNRNVGYGTKFHREAISKFGLSQYHRKSFNLGRWLRQYENKPSVS